MRVEVGIIDANRSRGDRTKEIDMGDMRDALRKAGLVSEKEARQSRHRERVHRKEVGDDGLAVERREKQVEFAEEREAKREKDRTLQRERTERARGSEGKIDVRTLIQDGVVPGAVGGPKQYFFTLPWGRITFLELSDSGFKRLVSGNAAIVDTLGAVRGDHCVVDAAAAGAIQKVRPDAIREWVRP